jgi:hypothetical protein
MGDIFNGFFKPNIDDFIIKFPSDDIFKDSFMGTKFENISSFKLEEDNTFKATFYFFEKVTSENVNIELNEDENQLTISSNYESDGCKYSTSITETLPNNADYDTMKAVLIKGVLTITFETKTETVNNDDEPINLNIKRYKK